MEFLLMSNEITDSSPFMDEGNPGELDLDWNSWNCVNSGLKKRKHEGNLSGTAAVTSCQGKRTSKIQRREASSSSRFSSWQQEDLEDNLASDLDGTCSLSALGVDLNSSNYKNISDALLALPSLSVYKEELSSPTANTNGGQCVSPFAGDSSSCSSDHDHINQLSAAYDSGISETEGVIDTAKRERFPPSHHKTSLGVTTAPATSTGSPPIQINDDCRFQYVLAAATSIATKVNEETLTYLNQGQSYEVRLKKLGDLCNFRGKILKSVIRLCFHERRLQFMEREQIAAWEASRPGDRIMEVDLPLSYGLFDLVQDPLMLNTVEFLWDPTKDVGVYIKVNCISTEFTPNKHGGEKGVPFRIQLDTYMHGDKLKRRLHSASCQIKVFKLKGADRKHKQDRVKIHKHTLFEQQKYQPSYECTVLSDLPNTADCLFGAGDKCAPQSTEPARGNAKEQQDPAINAVQRNASPELDTTLDFTNKSLQVYNNCLSSDSTALHTSAWLQSHRFSSYLRTFSSYSGADLLRLSRDDIIQICGLADGIRLFNALHIKAKTIYVCTPSSSTVYHALYLTNISVQEMTSKLGTLLGSTAAQIYGVYIVGPKGIHVVISDELLLSIKDGATFAIELLQDTSSDRCSILLKTTNY